jgi:hypothetical protein
MRANFLGNGLGRSRAWASACAALIALAAPPGAHAQGLPRLHVLSFALSSDNLHPRPQEPFHIIVDVRVREHVGNLDRVVLPTFGPLEILGDEKRVKPVNGGTAYRETIGVVAHHGGRITVPPAYLDARDARDGQPKRFLSNAVELEVQGAPARSNLSPLEVLRRAAWVVLGLSTITLIGVLGLILRQPPAPPLQVAPVTPRTAPAALPALNVYDSALNALRAHPTREVAMKARERIRASIGVTPYETLRDALRRPGAQGPQVRAALRTLERAAFTHDGDLPTAIADAIATLERGRA